MTVNSKSKVISIAFAVIAIIFLVTSINSFNRFKRKVIHLLEDTRKASTQARTFALANNLLLTKYEISTHPETHEAFKNTIFFAGHIYPQSGYIDDKNSRYSNPEHPLNFLQELFRRTPPLRVIFGGDNVETPTPGALKHLLGLKSEIGETRFVLGNHDEYWKKLKHKDVFKKIFHKRFYYEDVNNVRLIYLHTVSEDGNLGLDDDQRTFLKDKALLNDGSYKYALVFLHHALWASRPVTNTSYPQSKKLIDDWLTNVLPILKKGNTLGVFSGDGGVLSPGSKVKLETIWHYTTGWSMNREDIPPEWLKIDLKDRRVQVYWNKLVGGRLFVKKDEDAVVNY